MPPDDDGNPEDDYYSFNFHRLFGDADGSAAVDYQDFVMSTPASGQAIGGVCHARGTNSALPAQWLLYVTVTDLDASATRCKELGGEVLVGPKEMGSHGRYCVVRDPAGASIALFQHADPE